MILIAGGGIGGLAAALGLARQGFRVTVLEKSAALVAQGAKGLVYGRNIYQHANPKAVVAALILMARRLRSIGARAQSIAIHCIFGVQILLGIATAMSGVELWLAVMHQLTGALLVAATVWCAHTLGRQQ